MFGKKQMEVGERVLVILEADLEKKSVVLLGEGVYEGLFPRGDVDSTEPIERRKALKLTLAGKSMAPRLRLDSGEVAWGDEVHCGDLASGLEWLRQFDNVKTTTMAEARRSAAALAKRLEQAASRVTDWRVDQPDVRSWRCE